MSEQQRQARFPTELVDWAGHHSGGVKRLFDDQSGRPGKVLLKTNLLSKLQNWAGAFAADASQCPSALLLVGGPGNGKTEAIESTIRYLDESLGCGGKLVQILADAFHPVDGLVPRVVQVDAGRFAQAPCELRLSIVQDASVVVGYEGRSPASLLVEELAKLTPSDSSHIYLCCVNRGVLDDALIHALENGLNEPRIVLEAITRAVSLAANAPTCWPLAGFPNIAVWPMDAESLLVNPTGEPAAPAATLLLQALEPADWPASGTCVAGDQCPFCNSQLLLSREGPQQALLRILRWYELGSGKRWSFRDLFSLVSYLLAGHRSTEARQQRSPCEWAAELIDLDKGLADAKRPTKQALTAIFKLASSSYQHALFHHWDKEIATSLRRDIKELGLDSDRTLLGLQHFLHERRAAYLPATIASLLDGLVELLDPALANPDSEVAVSTRSTVVLRDLDIRFSRSITEGIEFVRKYQVLSSIEVDLLRRLAAVDAHLSLPQVRRKRPATATRVQHVLRDFAGRLVRRSICTRTATVADAEVLLAFQSVVEDDDSNRLYDVADQVERLLNNGQDFEVSLTTTFGQPLPPPQRQATLIVPSRPVGMLPPANGGRPRAPICFLEVGTGQSAQPIALTYDLFKAVKELERGLSPASLPRAVVALLDTTRARLAGPIVRDREILRRAKIRVGTDGTVIASSWDGFVSRNERHRQ
ncbi:hypothetical protein [Ralstonia holmesii]|uniref:hypothetical protein n=1 Tax=Ralstonia holmesii TaxID=3058602 RepID=UPI0028F4D4CE|nr:hypothetical protein [Ralstonia sp. LMG 32967]CAJ0691502.1 hypothetical protein R11007_01553 [Ralstonia sp. LMG 32967]